MSRESQVGGIGTGDMKGPGAGGARPDHVEPHIGEGRLTVI